MKVDKKNSYAGVGKKCLHWSEEVENKGNYLIGVERNATVLIE